jgi:hypothetical protein
VGISIYYVAKREQPLTPAEQKAINDLVGRYAIQDLLAEHERTGQGYNGESFCIYDPDDPTEPGAIFEGATRLPDNSEEVFWYGIQHWCRLLSEIRRLLSGASWQVHIDDHDVVWDEKRREYDPSQ